jgi:hypothetical protein
MSAPVLTKSGLNVGGRTARLRQMRPNETERTLKEMLDAAGVNVALPDPTATWRVFKQFAQMPVEDVASEDGDMCLFQWGTHDWGDGRGERFEIDFLRQFMIEVDGEYDHMEQLHCTFEFEPTDALRGLGSGEHWIAGDLAEGLSQVEALPVFNIVREAPARPRMARIEQEEV